MDRHRDGRHAQPDAYLAPTVPAVLRRWANPERQTAPHHSPPGAPRLDVQQQQMAAQGCLAPSTSCYTAFSSSASACARPSGQSQNAVNGASRPACSCVASRACLGMSVVEPSAAVTVMRTCEASLHSVLGNHPCKAPRVCCGAHRNVSMILRQLDSEFKEQLLGRVRPGRLLPSHISATTTTAAVLLLLLLHWSWAC